MFVIALDVIGTTISVLLAIIIGFAVGYLVRVWHREKSINASKELAEKIVEDGKKEAEKAKRESVLEAKQEIFVLRKDLIMICVNADRS